MKKLAFLFAFAVLAATPVLAQQTPKYEISLDGTFNRFDTPPGYYLDMPGGALAGNYTVFRWLSGKIELSGEYGHRALVGGTVTADAFAGPVFYPFRHHKITPWGEFLFGEGYYRNMIPAFGGFPSSTVSGHSFAYEGGLGLDWKLKQHWDVRPLEFDFVSSKFLSTVPNQIRQSNYRLQVGVVYKIGKH